MHTMVMMCEILLHGIVVPLLMLNNMCVTIVMVCKMLLHGTVVPMMLVLHQRCIATVMAFMRVTRVSTIVMV